MIMIANKREEGLLKNLPAEVVAKALEIAAILDENYGNQRDAEHDLGGYILIAETGEDLKAIRKHGK
ncbi:MAG: hypothetical protein ABF633_06755 [Clostridium sp.]|uniref:hypothetical protein n=1 Tax=Clostridium sp. TaxID=1506 RepID=UPI0039ECC56F